MKKVLSLAAGALLFAMSLNAYAGPVAANPYAHYDASIVPSITLGVPPSFVPAPYTQAVVGWADQANGFNATAPILGGGGQRDMVYPGPAGHTFSSGLVGIDAGDTPGNGTALSLLGAGAPQDNLLDFTGGASGNSGFSIYMTYHLDAQSGGNFDYLIANTAFANNVGPDIRVASGGWIWGGIDGTETFSGWMPVGGETIISLNYDANTGNLTIANANGSGGSSGSGSTNIGAGNFSSANFLGLGGSTQWANFHSDGDFGEVIIYDRFIDPTGSEHSDTIAALNGKWLVVPEPGSLALIGLGFGMISMFRRRK